MCQLTFNECPSILPLAQSQNRIYQIWCGVAWLTRKGIVCVHCVLLRFTLWAFLRTDICNAMKSTCNGKHVRSPLPPPEDGATCNQHDSWFGQRTWLELSWLITHVEVGLQAWLQVQVVAEMVWQRSWRGREPGFDCLTKRDGCAEPTRITTDSMKTMAQGPTLNTQTTIARIVRSTD